jgi:threonine dehydrogenase-like Zn-dependent dehydrogenase
VPLPSPGDHEVLVRLEGCGVCASNLPVWEGRSWFDYPLAAGEPGHEGWGAVERVGEGVSTVVPGDRVALVSNRAYAEFDCADEGAVVRIPQSLAGRNVPGEPLACAVNVFDRAGITRGQNVAIIGIGFLGAVLTQLAVDAGARVLAISRRPFARRLAERFGAESAIEWRDLPQTTADAAAFLGAELAPVVIEAVGTQASLDLATGISAIRGRIIIAGYHQDGPRTVDLQQWNWKGLDVINAHERDLARYTAGLGRAMTLLETGAIDVDPLLSDRFPLSRIADAFAMAGERPDGFVKAIVDPRS